MCRYKVHKVRYDGPHTRRYTSKYLTIFYNYTFVVPTNFIIVLVNVKKHVAPCYKEV